MANTAASVLATAIGELGYDRHADPKKGSKYGRWYEKEIDRNPGNYDFGANGVAFCAMFASWVLAQAGAKCTGFPNAYCPTIVARARSAGKALPASQAKPGDIVLFDWDGDGEADHVGFVERNAGGRLYTVEGNTNNGKVARQNRSYATVCCVVRPDYDGTVYTQPKATIGPVEKAQKYLIASGYSCGSDGADGIYGPHTKKALVRYLQAILNAMGATLTVDGVAGSATRAAWAKYGPVMDGSRGGIVKAVQLALMLNGEPVGDSGIDGVFGKMTTCATMAYQSSHDLEVDGIVGPMTFKALFS